MEYLSLNIYSKMSIPLLMSETYRFTRFGNFIEKLPHEGAVAG